VEGRLSPAPDTHAPGNELQFWIYFYCVHAGKLCGITERVFKDCNADNLEQIEERGLYVRNNFFEHPLQQMRDGFENKLAQALAARRVREGRSEMRIVVAALIVLAALYFWDKDYNNGKLLDGLESMRRSIAHHVFH
jgi:hypothetical protein